MNTPVRIAAVPAYIQSTSATAFADAAPGHRFMGYLRNTQGVGGDLFAPFKGKAKVIGNPAQGAERRFANEALKSETDAVLNEVCKLGESAKKQIDAIRNRQQILTSQYGANVFTVKTQSTAPFATGLGNEHPIENGFAFLTPYGLPYLAGSGVKGILRRAMQELRDDDEAGFTDQAIDAMFGPEETNQPEAAKRGALDFWDVFPKPVGDRLVVEIMTPHFGSYYQGKSTPHDSGAPIPVFFLAVPAKSQFDFHVVCHPTRRPESLQSTWRDLLQKAFDHAFAWVGFGAKTSVGYGAMSAAGAKKDAGTSTATSSAATAPSSQLESWPSARLKFNRNNNTLIAEANGKSANAYAPHSEALLKSLPAEVQSKIRQNQCFQKFAVQVEGTELRAIAP